VQNIIKLRLQLDITRISKVGDSENANLNVFWLLFVILQIL